MAKPYLTPGSAWFSSSWKMFITKIHVPISGILLTSWGGGGCCLFQTCELLKSQFDPTNLTKLHKKPCRKNAENHSFE